MIKIYSTRGLMIKIIFVDFKSHCNKAKISEMDISNINLKKTKVLK